MRLPAPGGNLMIDDRMKHSIDPASIVRFRRPQEDVGVNEDSFLRH